VTGLSRSGEKPFALGAFYNMKKTPRRKILLQTTMKIRNNHLRTS
jgi:hypothetical protein